MLLENMQSSLYSKQGSL